MKRVSQTILNFILVIGSLIIVPITGKTAEAQDRYIRFNLEGQKLRNSPGRYQYNHVLNATRGSVFKIEKIESENGSPRVKIMYKGLPYWVYPEDMRERDHREVLKNGPPDQDDLWTPGDQIPGESRNHDGSISIFRSTKLDDIDGNKTEIEMDRKIRPLEYPPIQNTCFDLNDQMPDFRRFRTTQERNAAFIRYMLPFALDLQQKTGLPAAVTMAQAGLETNFGTSVGFMTRKSPFGIYCPSSQVSYQFQRTQNTVRGIDLSYQSACFDRRPRNEGAYYRRFPSVKDALYAYARVLLGSKRYPVIQSAVNRREPGEPANFAVVVSGLKGYATDPGYQRKLRGIISRYHLDQIQYASLCNGHPSAVAQGANSRK